jgi:hypothetical protein
MDVGCFCVRSKSGLAPTFLRKVGVGDLIDRCSVYLKGERPTASGIILDGRLGKAKTPRERESG